MNYEELKDWCDEARRSVGREMDRLQEQQLTMGNHLQVLEAAGDLLGEMERQKDELFLFSSAIFLRRSEIPLRIPKDFKLFRSNYTIFVVSRKWSVLGIEHCKPY